jgi:hypothetical protein
MKQGLIALVLIAVGSLVAYAYVASQTYYPVTHVSSPDGLTFTAVQDPTRKRSACEAANERFLGPIRQQCSQCKIVLVRCDRQLEAFDLSVYEGKALAHYQVSGPGLRLAIAGPARAAEINCDVVAGELKKRGAESAACVYPNPQKKKAP